MSSEYDPNIHDDVDPTKEAGLAALGGIKMKLDGIMKTIPEIAANENVRREVAQLSTEVKRSYDRIRGEIIRARRSDV